MGRLKPNRKKKKSGENRLSKIPFAVLFVKLIATSSIETGTDEML